MTQTPVADTMREKLTRALNPTILELVDESARHIGHAGHDGRGESHFHLTLVSADFTGLGRLERQRRVYAILKDEMAGRVHALAMTLKTPDEFLIQE